MHQISLGHALLLVLIDACKVSQCVGAAGRYGIYSYPKILINDKIKSSMSNQCNMKIEYSGGTKVRERGTATQELRVAWGTCEGYVQSLCSSLYINRRVSSRNSSHASTSCARPSLWKTVDASRTKRSASPY